MKTGRRRCFADFNLGETPEFFESLRKRFLGQFLLCAFPRALTPDRTQSKNKTGTRSEFVPVRNDVPGGKNVGEFLPSGVEKAGGAGDEGLIEHLRKRIRVLDQVPVSLAFPPAPDTGPLPRPACSLLASVPSLPLSSLGAPANANPSPGKGEDQERVKPRGARPPLKSSHTALRT